MYAVIATGGKQEKVAEGQVLDVELLGEPEGAEVTFAPILLVDGDTVLATPEQLAAASVTARVVGDAKGVKVDGFVYKPKSRQQRHYGHRQRYTRVEITAISRG